MTKKKRGQKKEDKKSKYTQRNTQNKRKKTIKKANTHTKNTQNKTKGKKKEGARKKVTLPSHTILFFEWFSTCSLPVSSSKSLEDNPLMVLKLCYLLDAISSKSDCFLWVI